MNVVISGYYGYCNTGDELVLRAILTELKFINDKINFIVFSGNPKDTKILHGVESIYRFNPFKVINAIFSSDILVSGGGGLLQDVTSKRSIMYYLSIIFLAKILGKKVIIYSQGIGPINSSINRLFTGFVLKKVDLITLRDKKSEELINSLRVNKNIFVTSDPVFRSNLSGFIKDARYGRNDRVGIVVREIKHDGYKEIIAQVADKIIREKKLKVLFIPFQSKCDLRIAEDIRKHMKENAEIFNIDKDALWLDKIVNLISSLRLLVGMRLHSIIIAVKLNIPFVAISYDPKINNFLKSINYDRIVNIDNLSVNNLLSEVDFALSGKIGLNNILNKHEDVGVSELKKYFT